MPKLLKAIVGVPDGEIYPREISAGEDCPDNLIGYADGIGAIEKEKAVAKKPADGDEDKK